ncbi:DUF2149 domain-containing protein [Aureliella helgolandensis]|uniref:DUF2149 domain-containing protein n=1 Tax=Aureliella helgolandensis TaxID=2527968 RepID=A0A518G3R1_9BACT|nr:DUF2149 domain-containing protein [Aureliella helgolandensis]QDV23205.1 hypothetical protein Q31a_15030 [Aureliella helgolandensis]
MSDPLATQSIDQRTLLNDLRLRRLKRASSFEEDAEVEPLSGLANLFDAAMVFAVALMVALVSYLQVPALLKESDYTIITNPGTPDMEIVVKEGEEIKHYEASEATGAGQGELLGQAYRLPDGRVVYVPAEDEE